MYKVLFLALEQLHGSFSDIGAHPDFQKLAERTMIYPRQGIEDEHNYDNSTATAARE